MKEWNFKVFIDSKGQVDFYDWLDQQVKKAKVKIRERINYFEITPYWAYRPYASPLKDTDNIVELRIVFNNIQYRPLGCFGPRNGEFTILIGAIEDNGSFNPKNAIKFAEERCKLIHEDRRYIDDFV